MSTPTQRRPLTALAVLAAVIVSFLVLTAPARAELNKKEIPVTMDWRIGYANESKSTCASYGIATWREEPGAVAWELLYHFSPPNPAYAEDRSVPLTPPFDDEAFLRFGWQPAAGIHWHSLSYSGRSSGSGKPVSCDDFRPKQEALYSNVRILITTECDLDLVGKLQKRLKAAKKAERRAYNQRRNFAGKVGKFRKRAKRSGGGLDFLEKEELQQLNKQLKRLKRQEAVTRKKRKNAYKKFREEREKCVP
ncbi:MAG: hypothetical protein R2725_12305 [Solirubrobacterales bacterium]